MASSSPPAPDHREGGQVTARTALTMYFVYILQSETDHKLYTSERRVSKELQRFKREKEYSRINTQRPYRLTVRTEASQASNPGPTPGRVTTVEIKPIFGKSVFACAR